MILLRIPFALALALAMHVSTTAPQPPPTKEEKVKTHPADKALVITPIIQKTISWSFTLLEILIVLAHTYPSMPLSNWLLTHLNHSSFLDTTLYTNPIYLLSWVTAIIAAAVRKRCFDELGKLFTFDVGILKNHRLVTTGPYAFVRHPSYTAAIVTSSAIHLCHSLSGSYYREELSALLSPSLVRTSTITFTVVGFVAGMTTLGKRILLENEILRREFGSQWDDWARRVPYNLVPGVW